LYEDRTLKPVEIVLSSDEGIRKMIVGMNLTKVNW
jgi:hypothetical protein